MTQIFKNIIRTSLWMFPFLCFGQISKQYVPLQKITIPNGANINFGYSADINSDGTVAIMGGDATGAWIFTKSGSVWVTSTSLGGPTGFGRSVAITADGTTAIVGSVLDSSGYGCAHIYKYNGTGWENMARLRGSGGKGSLVYQGWSVDISLDGTTAIVGGIADDGYRGAAWIFTLSGTNWKEVGKFIGTGAVYGTNPYVYQGSCVSLSGDGKTALVGANGDNSGFGAAWLYTFSGGNFTQLGAKLIPLDGISTGTGNGIQFGHASSLSSDGKIAVIGGRADNSLKGAVWIFTFTGSNFVQAGPKLTGSGTVGASRIGGSVAITPDAKTIVAGGYSDKNYTGACWVFTGTGGSWSQMGPKLVGFNTIGNYPQFGFSVGVTADSKTIITGGTGDNSNWGAGWIFNLSTTGYVVTEETEIDTQLGLRIYPNPTNDIIRVYMDKLNLIDYSITDIIGNKVSEGILKPGNNEINLNGLSGVFYLQIGDRFKKFVKY